MNCRLFWMCASRFWQLQARMESLAGLTRLPLKEFLPCFFTLEPPQVCIASKDELVNHSWLATKISFKYFMEERNVFYCVEQIRLCFYQQHFFLDHYIFIMEISWNLIWMNLAFLSGLLRCFDRWSYYPFLTVIELFLVNFVQ